MALEECLALGCAREYAGSWRLGVRPIVAVPWVCVPTWTRVDHLSPADLCRPAELEAWGQQQPVLPLLVEKLGRDEGRGAAAGMATVYSAGARWSITRDGSPKRNCAFVVVHSSSTGAAASAGLDRRASQGSRGAVTAHVKQAQARWFACEADAAAAIGGV